MSGIEILCAVLMTALIEPSVFAAANATDFSVLNEAVQEELNVTNTPGCTVAIVSGDKIVYAKGFSVANAESRLPVTPETLFLIASTTKALHCLHASIPSRRWKAGYQ